MNRIKMCCCLIGFVCCVMGVVSCKTEEIEAQLPEKFPGVEDDLKPFFEKFEYEASIRGIQVDLTEAGIQGVINEINSKNVVGRCSYSVHNPRLVTVDASFWQHAGQLYREFIVFHELGHCYLARDHEESTFSNGLCVSIMRSGLGRCYDSYSQNTRNYYINELFEPELLK